MPDFQQFADECVERRRWLVEHSSDSDADRTFLEFNDVAERHARLLQQIWEWTNSPPEFAQYYGPVETAATGRAKAHVRSLLVSQTDK